jgi:hypothetical protein
MTTPARGSWAAGLVNLFSRMRYPWLVALLGGLFAVDLFVPDPLPFVDEAILAALTLLLARLNVPETTPRDTEPWDDTPPRDDCGSSGSVTETSPPSHVILSAGSSGPKSEDPLLETRDVPRPACSCPCPCFCH